MTITRIAIGLSGIGCSFHDITDTKAAKSADLDQALHVYMLILPHTYLDRLIVHGRIGVQIKTCEDITQE